MKMKDTKANELASVTKANGLKSVTKASNILLSSKAILKEFLSEEEAIEEEMEGKYKKLTDLFKRKFKPALWEESESKLKQKSFLNSTKSNRGFLCARNEESKYTLEKLAKIGAYASIAGLGCIYATEAMAVDIEAAAKAGVKPLRNTIVWVEPYLLGFAGIAGAYFAEGDLKTKAVKTGIGVGALYAVSSALLSWMPNIA